MSATEQLPADLDKLKITQTHPVVKSTRNPFYTSMTSTNTNSNFDHIQSVKQRMAHRWRCRIRRRSESFLDDCKLVDSVTVVDTFEIVNPLRCSHGVSKHTMKKNHVPTAKKNLLREPILRSLQGSRRPLPSNTLDEPNAKANSTANTKPSSNGTCSFRDLIKECNSLLDESKNNSLSSSCFTLLQRKETPLVHRMANGATTVKSIAPSTSTPLLGSTCSQQASSSNGTNSSNCDDVTIVELASYFDTMVHIPKKMSTMAEMMYI